MKIELTVNGQAHTLDVPPDTRLLDVLREDLGLASIRAGCDVGFCGACTALIEGQPYSTCLLLAAQLDGQALTTIEGLAPGDALHPAQQAFIDKVGLQCGYCTPGFVLAAAALVEGAEAPLSDDDIAHGMAGNLCRCGSYLNILEAVRAYRDGLSKT